MLTLPCTLSGRSEFKGVARLESSGLVIEFNKWSWQNLGTQVEEVTIYLEDVARVQFKKGVVVTRVDIQLSSIKGYEAFIFSSERPAGLVRVKFARKDREEAERMVSIFSLAVSEVLLNRTSEDE